MSQPSEKSWPWWRFALTGLSALALALSSYLGWHYLTGGSVIGCNGGSPCEQVLSSRWSAIAGVVPVSGLAAGTNLAILIASFFIGPAVAAPDRRLAWSAILVLIGAAAGSAVWFIIVQKFIIRAFCPYCMATHITGLILTALVLWQVPRQNISATDPRSGIVAFPAIGLILAGILTVCQIAIKSPLVYRGGQSQADQPSIDPHAWPIIGSPDAPFIVALLFDYQCPHCQELHSMIDEAIARYNGKLAFVMCPAPLNNQCNPFISRETDEFKDSCELAKIGLAVWLANRQAFGDFDRWMFSPDPGQSWQPRTLDDARAKAVELVGQAKFDAARADPWIDRYMKTSVRIYGDTINPDQTGNAVPKLLFRSRWVTPQPHDTNDLIVILQDTLGMPRP